MLAAPTVGSGDAVDLDWHGVLEVGVGYQNKYHHSPISHGDVYNDKLYQIGRAKLEAEVDIGERLEARFDLRGDINDFAVVLRKAYIDIDVIDWLQVRVGNAKRELTMEEMVGSEELRTPERSLAHEHVESFHVLGYAFGFQARAGWPRRNEPHTSARVGVSLDGAGRVVTTLGASRAVTEHIAAVASYLLLVRLETNSSPAAVSNLAGVGWELDRGDVYAAVEMVGGRDPAAGALRRRMGGTGDVVFALVRAACFPFLRVGEALVRGVEPGMTLVYLVPDCARHERGRVQAIPSCNVYFGPEERVRVMVSGAFVGHTDYAARELRKESYGATVQMQVAW